MTVLQTPDLAVAPGRREIREVRADDWLDVCAVEGLLTERGVAALVGHHQVALFRRHDGSLRAVDNVDPFTGAGVLSRGLVGSRGGISVVTSPLHKQAFDLDTGHCLDDSSGAHDVLVWQVRLEAERVLLGVPDLGPQTLAPTRPTA